MIKGFICPNGTKVPFDKCFEHCTNRCATLPILILIKRNLTKSNTHISVTQLLKGTRQTYLELTKDYYVPPKDMIFSLFGTAIHNQLELIKENKAKEELKKIKQEIKETLGEDVIDEHGELKETFKSTPIGKRYYKTKRELYNEQRFINFSFEERIFLTIDNNIKITGIPDLYDRKNKALYDYKISGSYAIASAKETGKKEWTFQLNAYRIALEQNGYPVESMYIQAITRDGGLYTARQKGIENMEIIPVEFISDNIILEFYKEKYKALITAIETNQMPPPCSNEESWNGKKCKYYCPVLEYCPEGQKRAKNIA